MEPTLHTLAVAMPGKPLTIFGVVMDNFLQEVCMKLVNKLEQKWKTRIYRPTIVQLVYQECYF